MGSSNAGGITVLPSFKRVKDLVNSGKIQQASVFLMNNADHFSPSDFKLLNKEIKNLFPKSKTEGAYPTSNGRKVRHGPSGGNGHY